MHKICCFLSQQEEPKIIDTQALQVCRKRVCPRSSQDEFESRRLWHKVTHALRTDDIESATSAKHEVSRTGITVNHFAQSNQPQGGYQS